MNASDPALESARTRILHTLASNAGRATIETVFDEPTFTASYVVHDPATRDCAIVDSVLGFDPASGRTDTTAADRIAAYVCAQELKVEWLLETHVHADHLSAAPYLQRMLGGRLAIGHGILKVQNTFGKVFNAGTEFARDGSQFDRLFDDGETFAIGGIEAIALHVPGHTPADMAYVVGDAVFVGDTLFMPDGGTARADFPGGDARQLYRSIHRLLDLPEATRLYLCHDYKAPGRETFAWRTTVGDERRGNIHVRNGVGEDAFVALREARDATLSMPRLILPSLQVNMRAGELPEPEDNGVRYLKLPLNSL